MKALLSALFLSASLSAQIGTAHSSVVIGNGPDGLDGQLQAEDYFGTALAFLGDLDGDGIAELAVGAPDEPWPPTQEDSVWILFLRADGTVRASTRLAEGVGGFSDPDALSFGWAVAGAGDVDGDGVPDLAAGVYSNEGGLGRGSLWILFLNRDGTVRTGQRIGGTSGGFTGRLSRRAALGSAVTSLGDLDGDGIAELAVGAPNRGPGVVFLLHLNPDGTVRSLQEIDETIPALSGLMVDGDRFGGLLAAGDLDGDGDVDLAVGGPLGQLDGKVWIVELAADQTVEDARIVPRDEVFPPDRNSYWPSSLAVPGDLDGDGSDELVIGAYDYLRRGAVAVAGLTPDLAVRRSALMGPHLGGFDLPPNHFGYAVAAGPDLDGDGRPELAVGTPYVLDDEGRVLLVELERTAVRTGGASDLLPLSTVAEPRLGRSWSAKLDCSGRAPGVAVLAAVGAPLEGRPTVGGLLLVDPASPRYFTFAQPHRGDGVAFVVPVPNEIALLNLVLHVQGASIDAGGLRLSEALAVIVGR